MADRGPRHALDEDSARLGMSERVVGVLRAHAISQLVHSATCEQEADSWLCARFTDGEAEVWREPGSRAGPGCRSARFPGLCWEMGSSELPVRASLPVSGHTEAARRGGKGTGSRASGTLRELASPLETWSALLDRGGLGARPGAPTRSRVDE